MNKNIYKIKDNLIVFDYKYNESISNKLSSLLSECNIIIFSDYGTFESTLKNYLKLNFEFSQKKFKGSNFNQPLNNLPITIKKIFLGYSFNHPLDNLPSNLELLKLGYNFNQSLDYLPESLNILILNNNNISLNNLPNSLKVLVVFNVDKIKLDNLPKKNLITLFHNPTQNNCSEYISQYISNIK
jgi:hypothetical protein